MMLDKKSVSRHYIEESHYFEGHYFEVLLYIFYFLTLLKNIQLKTNYDKDQFNRQRTCSALLFFLKVFQLYFTYYQIVEIFAKYLLIHELQLHLRLRLLLKEYTIENNYRVQPHCLQKILKIFGLLHHENELMKQIDDFGSLYN